MESELKSMFLAYIVQNLVEAPEEMKPIGYKWIYKRKKGVDGKVKTYKARLIVKGYGEKSFFDYEETSLSDA